MTELLLEAEKQREITKSRIDPKIYEQNLVSL